VTIHESHPSETGREVDDRDAGFTLVLVALLLTGMLTIVALVIDMGYVRGVARSDQSIADMAAMAGSEHLEQNWYVEACQDMIKYLNLNAKDMPVIDASGFCAPIGATLCPDQAAPLVAPSASAGKYTVTIEFPVPDESPGWPAMGSGVDDGEECERMRVTVRSVSEPFFGGVVGASEYDVTRSATLRAGVGDSVKAPALWLLEPYGCDALTTSGSGTTIIVGDMAVTPPIEGLITLDSDASTCGGQNVTVDAGSGTIHARPTLADLNAGIGDPKDPGEIRVFGADRTKTTCVLHICREAQVSGGNLLPRPSAVRERATRAPVDHRWNCKTGYPTYAVASGPALEIPDCPDASTRAPYIDKLRAAVGSTGMPSGFVQAPGACAGGGGGTITISEHVTLEPANWYFPCRVSVSNHSSLTIKGGNVVINGGLSTGSSSSTVSFNSANNLNVTGLPSACLPGPSDSLCTHSSPGAAWVYLRNGGLDVKHQLNAAHTAIYVNNGGLIATGGGGMNWTAPVEGPFAGLAAWSEAASNNSSGVDYSLGGGANVTMSGAFFTPYADAMKIAGGGGWNVRNAQYISRRLVFSGNSTLTMAPNAVTALTLPPKEGFLIR
jgi:hypothetical protein